MGALAIVDFLDRYTSLCSRKKLVAIESLMSQLQLALNSGYYKTLLKNSIFRDAIESLILKGTIPDIRKNRINDDMVDVLINSFSAGGFLKILDLSYNEIGDKGAITIAKFIKVLLSFIIFMIGRFTFRNLNLKIKFH